MSINDLINYVKRMCTPAQLYLALSIMTISTLLFANLGNKKKYTCFKTINTTMNCSYYFILKLIYVVIWALILQYLCDKGYENMSWFFVLFPYILMLLIIFLALSLSNTFF